MGLVLPDNMTANLVKRFGVLEQLQRAVSEQTGKTVRFDPRTAGLEEKEPVYISQKDLEQIHMHIDLDTEE